MDTFKRFTSGETLEAVPDIVIAYYSFYGVLGFAWRWDRFDLGLLAVTAMSLIPRLWRDAREVHYNCTTRLHEIAWQRERAGRKHRRVLAQIYLKGKRDGR